MDKGYLSLYDLNDEQVRELRGALMCDIYDNMWGASPSWGELAAVDEIISDGLLVAAYDGVGFCEDDFNCSCNW